MAMPKPIWVLNPRPINQAQELSACLSTAGFLPMEIPLLATRAASINNEHRNWLLNLDLYNGVIFVSAAAAGYGLNAIFDLWPQWPQGPIPYAIGASTAQYLSNEGLRPYFPPEPSHANSEGLLALPSLQSVHQQRFLLCRGEDGRELLYETLLARGALVDRLPVYQRFLPPEALSLWQQRSQDPDIVILTSPHILENWCQIAGDFAIKPLWIIVGERMRALAEARQARYHLAEGADKQSLLVSINNTHLR